MIFIAPKQSSSSSSTVRSTGEPEGMSEDNVRDEYLGRLGLTVCRYQNSEVMKNFDGVCTDILIRLNGAEFE